MPACEIGAALTVTDYDVRSLYLDLLRRNLTRYGMRERMPSGWPLRRRLVLKAANSLIPMRILLPELFLELGLSPFDRRARELGLDWPPEAETMIGMQRLTSLQRCVETVPADDIPAIWSNVECGAEGLAS